jgi:hypothetical protein
MAARPWWGKGVATSLRGIQWVSTSLLDEGQGVLQHITELLDGGLHGDGGLRTEEGSDVTVQLVLAVLTVVRGAGESEGCVPRSGVGLAENERKRVELATSPSDLALILPIGLRLRSPRDLNPLARATLDLLGPGSAMPSSRRRRRPAQTLDLGSLQPRRWIARSHAHRAACGDRRVNGGVERAVSSKGRPLRMNCSIVR